LTVIAAILAAFLAGCASGVKRADDTARREAYFAGGCKVAGEVTFALDKNALAQLSGELRFVQGRLLSTVKRALDARGLFAMSPDPSHPMNVGVPAAKASLRMFCVISPDKQPA